jgi:hypothetical protein
MSLKTLLTLSALFLAVPAFAQDQTRQQTRDPSSHVDGAAPTQQRDRTRDQTHEASQDRSRERSRSMSGGAGKGSGAGTGGGSGGGSGSAYRGGR